ncbi:hypothetical protein HYH02_001906 [Chlamydomonas schloesseri]|uniref:Uncharacterized protein n=1 Tax=Chlamydomonas schloesseri TaxID=2026947 RepID=A0A835WUJ3_9CHLO|nr:hypothetical protein HYH02_001906 [Chlamydomonas schloesseri]|eukprot:KAG2453694.1 hypothetical protein HYH02_001906 [Chlamydomonas schloesseri]
MDISSLWAEASEEEVEPSLASTGSGEADRRLVTRAGEQRRARARARSAAAPSTAPPNKRTQLQQPAPPTTPDRAQPQPQYAPSDASSAATAPYPSNPMSAAALTTPQRRPSAPPSTPAPPGPGAGTSGGGGLVLVPSCELQLSGDLAAALEAELQEIERKYIDAELPPRRSSPGSTRRWSAAQSPAASGGGAGAAAQRPSSVSRHYQLHPEAAPQDGKPSTDTLSQLLSRLQQQHPYGPDQGADGPSSPAVQALGQGLQTVHGAYDRLESRVRELRALVSGSPHSSAPPSTAASARNSPGRSEAGSGQVLGVGSSPAQRQAGTLEGRGAGGAEVQGASMPSLATLSASGHSTGHGSSNWGTGGALAADSNGEVGSATRALDLLLGMNVASGDKAASQGQAAAAAGTAIPAATGGDIVGDGAANRAPAADNIPAHVSRSSPDGSSGVANQETGSRTSTAAGVRNSGCVSTPPATSTGSVASSSSASEVTLRYTSHLSHTPQLSQSGERHRQQQLQQQQPSHMAPPQPLQEHRDVEAGGRAQHGQPQEEREPRISDADVLVPLVGQGREEDLRSGNPLSRAVPDGGAAVMEARARLAAATAAGTRSAAAAAAAAKADADQDAAREAARHLPPPTVFQTVLAADRPARVQRRQLGTLDASALLPPAHVTSVVRPLLRLARDSEAAADADSTGHGMHASSECTQPPAGSEQADGQSDASAAAAAAAAAAARAEGEALELLEALEWSVAADAAALDDEFLAVLGRRLGHLDLAHVNGGGAAAGAVPTRGTAQPAAGVDTSAAFGGPAAAAVAAAMAAAAGVAGGRQDLEAELLRAARQTAMGAVQSRLEQLQARYESRRRHRRAASTSSAAAASGAMAAAPSALASTGAAAAAGSSTPSKGLRGILAQCASPSRHAAAGGTSSPAAAAAGGGALASGFARSPRYVPAAAAANTAAAAAASTVHPPPPAAARRLYAAGSSLTSPPHTAGGFPNAHNSSGPVHAGSPACASTGQQPYPHRSSNGQTQPSPTLFATASGPSPAASRGYFSRASAPSVGTAAHDAATAPATGSSSSAESGLHLPPATTPEELEELRALCGMARHLPQLGPLERVQLWGRVGEVLAHKLARSKPAAQPQGHWQQQQQQRGGFADRPASGSRYATPVKAAGPEAEVHNADAGSPGSEGRAAGPPQWGSIHSGGSQTRGYTTVWERRQNSTGSGRPRGRSGSPTRNAERPNSSDRKSPGGTAQLTATQANPGAGQGSGRLRLVTSQQRSSSPAAGAPPAKGPGGAVGAGASSPGGAALLDSTMEVVHRLIAPNATLAQAMSLNWKAVRTHLATQEAAASPQRLALSPKG